MIADASHAAVNGSGNDPQSRIGSQSSLWSGRPRPSCWAPRGRCRVRIALRPLQSGTPSHCASSPCVALRTRQEDFTKSLAIWSETELVGGRPIGFDVSHPGRLTRQDNNAIGSSSGALSFASLSSYFLACFSGKRFSPPGGCDRGPDNTSVSRDSSNVRKSGSRRPATNEVRFASTGALRWGDLVGQLGAHGGRSRTDWRTDNIAQFGHARTA